MKTLIVGCITCLEGYYCASEGLSSPTGACTAGYYCKSGAYSASPLQGSTASSCTPGNFCPSGSVTELKCPIGSYNDAFGSTSSSACLSCPTGFYCSAKGQTSSFYGFSRSDSSYFCADGYQCLTGAKDPNPTTDYGEGALCPAGKYCTKGKVIDCQIGTY